MRAHRIGAVRSVKLPPRPAPSTGVRSKADPRPPSFVRRSSTGRLRSALGLLVARPSARCPHDPIVNQKAQHAADIRRQTDRASIASQTTPTADPRSHVFRNPRRRPKARLVLGGHFRSALTPSRTNRGCNRSTGPAQEHPPAHRKLSGAVWTPVR